MLWRMRTTWRVLCGAAICVSTWIASAGAAAAAYPAPQEGTWIAHGVSFTSGESMTEVRLHYRTIGTPQRDGAGVVRNAVLILHGTGGAGSQFLQPHFADELFGPGQLLDATKYYLILPDNIGHGQSSKPSDGAHMKFPHYGYVDMVTLQYRLLTEGLKVNHLRLVMGTSMGGMQSWMWGYMYPTFMDGLMPLASAPTQIAGRNRIWRKMAMDAIREDPEWKNGEYTTQPAQGLAGAVRMLILAGSVPLYWQTTLAPTREAADAYLASQMAARMKTTDANDTLYQIDSSRDYDPSTHLDQIVAPLLAINSADDQVNPPELGIVERLIGRVKHGRFVLIPISDKTRGHGTHTWAAVWHDEFAKLLASLPPAGATQSQQ
jgi:homoserine O-acetyltransferase/O-succinyltransferase